MKTQLITISSVLLLITSLTVLICVSKSKHKSDECIIVRSGNVVVAYDDVKTNKRIEIPTDCIDQNRNVEVL